MSYLTCGTDVVRFLCKFANYLSKQKLGIFPPQS